jgi:uncharacterized phiE125 gp8 family phage protein
MLHPSRPVLVTAPSATPISVAEAKAHCRVEDDEEDSLFAALIATATGHLDGPAGILGKCLMSQTWRVDFQSFPRGRILRLPLEPVISATLAYVDTAGTSQSWAASGHWDKVTDDLGVAIVLKADASWPSTADVVAAVSVTAVCGYGEAAADVPPPIRHALLLAVADLYRSRETTHDPAGISSIKRFLMPQGKVRI